MPTWALHSGPFYAKQLQHFCSYLVIPIPGPPTPIAPPAAAPLTGFMCCPTPGCVPGAPGMTDPIIPAAPGSPPPSMLASFPISVSAQGNGREVEKGIGSDRRFISLCCRLSGQLKRINGKKGGREPRQQSQRCSSISAIIILISFSTSRLPPSDVMTGACSTATATAISIKGVWGERNRGLIVLKLGLNESRGENKVAEARLRTKRTTTEINFRII